MNRMMAKLTALTLTVLTSILYSMDAHAFGAGVFGYSGKPPAQSCSECHSGGAAPMVSFEGPASLLAGETATYAIDVVTGASTSCAGFDVATSAGALATVPQTNESLLNSGEISHTKNWPKGKTVRVMFNLTAPAQDGPLTLFATALDSDCVDDTSGDSPGSATYAVTVSTPAPNADLSSMPDLLAMDAISSATEHPKPKPGPVTNEARWACGVSDGTSLSGAALALAALLALALRRRAR